MAVEGMVDSVGLALPLDLVDLVDLVDLEGLEG